MCICTQMNLDHPSNCLTFNLQRAVRSMVRGFEASIQGAGLTAPQFSTLAMLFGYGERTVGQMADYMGTDRTTLTRNLDLIAAKGWIEAIETEDRRLRVWRLTETGRDRLEAAMPAWKEWQARLVGVLGEDAARGLLAAASKL